MEEQHRTSIQESLHHYKEGLGYFIEQMPEVGHKYQAFTEACFHPGQLSAKEKQMIALGISLYAQDEYCIIYHVKGCIDQGATREEILETLAVTGAFGGGAAMSQAVTLVEECIEELSEDNLPS